MLCNPVFPGQLEKPDIEKMRISVASTVSKSTVVYRLYILVVMCLRRVVVVWNYVSDSALGDVLHVSKMNIILMAHTLVFVSL